MLDVCKCCLEDGNFKNLWTQYKADDGFEVYGEILNDCFGLSWAKPSDSSDIVEQICDFCISRLRHANYFKILIQISESKLNEFLETTETSPEPKKINKSPKKSSVKSKKNKESDNYLQEDDDAMDECTDSVIRDQNDGCLPSETIREESMELTKDDEESRDYNPDIDDDLDSDSDDVDPELLKAAMANSNKPSNTRSAPRRYNKKYSETSLRLAVHAVLNEGMSRSEASRIYGVPRKTVGFRIDKILDNSNATLEYKEKPKFYEHQHKFAEELLTILSKTNATPFKTRQGHYFCAYCSATSEPIDDPVQLRDHTLKDHPKVNISQVKNMMEPLHFNEIIRVDIHNFRCTNCVMKLETWNDMIIHMKEIHDYDFQVSLKRVIPYVLTDTSKINCALCNETLKGIMNLDNHMNYHYDSYICSVCGIPLLTYKRFKKHENSHTLAQYSCNECFRDFKSKRFLINHMQESHDINKKNEDPRQTVCDICSKQFTNFTKLSLHIRRTHNNEKNKECPVCQMGFFSAGEVTKHMVTHTKEKKYECSLCDKKFGKNTTLRQHYRLHPEVKIGKTDRVSKKIILTPV